MKNKIKNLLLVFGLSIILSLNTYGQRDTIKFYPYKLRAAIKDSNAYPIGLSGDSFVITLRPELDSILKKFKVYSMFEQTSPPDTNCNNNHYRQYKLICNCNEYLLLDTLIKFNIYNNYNFICRANLIPKPVVSLQDFKEIKNLNIYPNPVYNNLTIEVPKNSEYKIKIFNSCGSLIYLSDKISTTYSLNISNQKPGLYLINISSDSKSFFLKFMKN